MTKSVRISDQAHAALRELADRRGESMASALERLVDDERRRQSHVAANEVYAALRADPQGWAAVVEERAAWDAAVADGLDGSPDGRI
jgi:hypothetical protein